MLKLFIQHLIFISVSALVSYLTIDFIQVEQVQQVISSLQNVSIGVFTLSGIWVAYIYPEAITAFTNPEKVSLLKGSENAKRIESLVLVIFTSAFVLLTTLIFNLAEALLINLPLIQKYKCFITVSALTTVIYLTIIQAKAVGAIMLINIKFVSDLYNLDADKKANEKL